MTTSTAAAGSAAGVGPDAAFPPTTVQPSTPTGGRVQLALNVSDLDAAVSFYSRLFATPPAKRRPGYANFAIMAPPLKLVLIESPDARGDGVVGALNHVGVEVADRADVAAAGGRLSGQGLATFPQEATTCCHAVQDKVWVHDPDGVPWEVYTVLADVVDGADLRGDGRCCGGDATCTADWPEVTGPGGAVPAAAPGASGQARGTAVAATTGCC